MKNLIHISVILTLISCSTQSEKGYVSFVQGIKIPAPILKQIGKSLPGFTIFAKIISPQSSTTIEKVNDGLKSARYRVNLGQESSDLSIRQNEDEKIEIIKNCSYKSNCQQKVVFD